MRAKGSFSQALLAADVSPFMESELCGFRRMGHPHRRRRSLQWQLGKFH